LAPPHSAPAETSVWGSSPRNRRSAGSNRTQRPSQLKQAQGVHPTTEE